MKKILIGSVLFSLVFAISISSATAENQSDKKSDNQSDKAVISACMRVVTTQKKVAFEAAQKTFLESKQVAKERGEKTWFFSKVVRDLRKIRGEAKKVAKVEFEADKKDCKSFQDNKDTKNGSMIILQSQNNSGISGVAKLKEENGKVKVSLKISGGTVGIAEPAHIHVGACPNPGAVKYPLNFVINGKSETSIENKNLALLKSELPLAINVHKSTTESNVYVACGDLSF